MNKEQAISIEKKLVDGAFYAIPMKYLQIFTIIANTYGNPDNVGLVINSMDTAEKEAYVINNNRNRQGTNEIDESLESDFTFGLKGVNVSDPNAEVIVSYDAKNKFFNLFGYDIKIPLMEVFGDKYMEFSYAGDFNHFEENYQEAHKYPIVFGDIETREGVDIIQVRKFDVRSEEISKEQNGVQMFVAATYNSAQARLEYQYEKTIDISHAIADYENICRR